MSFKEPRASTSDFGIITLTGDLGGTAASPSVLKINGASVPTGSGLTTGNVLQVSGSTTLTYGAINLAGGAGFITGNLPVGNFTPGISGQVLMSNATPATAWTTIGGDVTISATGSVTTNQISGASPVNITTSSIFQWSAGVSSPTLKQAVNATTAGQALTIQAQNAAGTNQTGGNLDLQSGTKTGTGFDGYVLFQPGGTTQAFVSSALTNFMSTGGLGIGATPGTSPTITGGTGVPATTQPNGSIFLRTDGTSSTGVYTRQSAAWGAVGGGGSSGSLAAPITATPITTNSTHSTYTIDTTGGGSDAIILHSDTGAVSYVLPAPTTGREIEFQDISGTVGTAANNVFFAPHAAEKINTSSGFTLTGTFTVSNGSTGVTATSSQTGILVPGMSIVFGADTASYIISVVSGTSITLSSTYGGILTSGNTAKMNSLTFAANFGRLFIRSNGTDWFIKGDGTPTVITYTASGTHIPPAGVTVETLQGFGGGGGGGGGGNAQGGAGVNGCAGGGGGGGGSTPSTTNIIVIPNTAYTITVGGGGGGGAAGTNPGSAGAATKFGTLASFFGGSGGGGGSIANGQFVTLGGAPYSTLALTNTTTTTNNVYTSSSTALGTNGTSPATYQSLAVPNVQPIVEPSPTVSNISGWPGNGGDNGPTINTAGTTATAGTTGNSNGPNSGGNGGTSGAFVSTTQLGGTGGGGGGAGPNGQGGGGGGGGGASVGAGHAANGTGGSGANNGSNGTNGATGTGGTGGAGGAGNANSGAGGGAGGGGGNGGTNPGVGGAGAAGGSGQLIVQYVL